MMRESSSPKVIIVGAGIAGLTAAWELKKAGISSLVLEAENIVGGRMRTIQVEDALIDVGAQFLSTAYSVIPGLVEETGLKDKLFFSAEKVGIVNHQHIACFHPLKSWELVSSGLISFPQFMQLAFQQLKSVLLPQKKSNRKLNDITDWVSEDAQSASQWTEKNFSPAILQTLIAPMINGFYFQSAEHSSAALAAPIMGFSAYKPANLALTTGMGSLPQKMAEALSIKTNTAVSRIVETSNSLNIITSNGEFTAEHIILAAPAPAVKWMIEGPDENMLSLLETKYSSTILIALLIDSAFQLPEKFKEVHGLVVNPLSDYKIAALSIENHKCPMRKKSGYLINLMLNDFWAKKFLALSDEFIYLQIKSEIEKLLPGMDKHLQSTKLCRWENAMPYTPIGRASAVKAYRESRRINNKIWLAGDYMGLPWTDSAAQTGVWAAHQVIKAYP